MAFPEMGDRWINLIKAVREPAITAAILASTAIEGDKPDKKYINKVQEMLNPKKDKDVRN